MQWLSSLFAGGTSKLVDSIGGVVDDLFTTEEEKGELDLKREQLKLKLRQVLQAERAETEKTVRQSLESRDRVIKAEMQSGNNYVRAARPTIVYVGLATVVYNYCVIPTVQMVFGEEILPFNLPAEFWAAFATVVSVWSGGRSWERISGRNRLTQGITGTPVGSLFDVVESKAKG